MNSTFQALFSTILTLFQGEVTPDSWLDALSKGSPYVLAVVILALVTGWLIPRWAWLDKVEENKQLRAKIDELNGVILDLARKARTGNGGEPK